MKPKDAAQLAMLIDSIIDDIQLLDLLEPVTYLRDIFRLLWQENQCRHLDQNEARKQLQLLYDDCIHKNWALTLPGRTRQLLILLCDSPCTQEQVTRSWCSLQAQRIRRVRKGKSILSGIWAHYPPTIQQEENRAFDEHLALLEEVFSQSLMLYGAASRGNAVSQRQIYAQKLETFWTSTDKLFFIRHLDLQTIIEKLMDEKKQLSAENSLRSAFIQMKTDEYYDSPSDRRI